VWVVRIGKFPVAQHFNAKEQALKVKCQQWQKKRVRLSTAQNQMCAAVSSDLMTLEYLQRIDQGLEEDYMEDDEEDADDFTNTDHDDDNDDDDDNNAADNNTSTNTDTADAIAVPQMRTKHQLEVDCYHLDKPLLFRNDNNQTQTFLRVPKSSSLEMFDRNMRRTSFFDNLLCSLPTNGNKDKAVEWLLKYIGKKHDATFAKVAKELGFVTTSHKKMDAFTAAAMWEDSNTNTTQPRTILR
jgi:hypothetical protein